MNSLYGVHLRSPARPSMATLISFVSVMREVEISDLKGRSTYAHIAQPRQEFMYLARKAGFTLNQIGRFLGRDHSTILSGARAHEARRAA